MAGPTAGDSAGAKAGTATAIDRAECHAPQRLAPFSVIVPAHQEEAVIARCLARVYEGAPDDALPEVVVVANGCSDRTAEIAHSAAPQATVIELTMGSKTGALNAGSRIATAVPRLFVDADVECTYASMAAVAAVLRSGKVLAASPALRMDFAHSDRWVQAYYRVWLTQPYATDALIGGGVYGLSAEGLKRVGAFPEVIGDDVYVRTRFARDERQSVRADANGLPVQVTVSPPRTARAQIRIEARRRVGSDQVLHLYPGPHNGRINRAADLGAARRAGARWIDIGIYLAMKAAARVLCRWNAWRGRSDIWLRDETTRLAGDGR